MLFRITPSRAVWALTLIVCIWFYGKYGREAYNFYGDALGYYMYLPATFIYHNHTSIERLPKDRGIRPFIHGYAAQIGNGQRGPKGFVLNQYTYGPALMEAPFFFAAHAWERLSGGLANGFSDAYRNAITVSTVFYGILGLWITYRVLRRRYGHEAASLTTALLLLGTNLFWFMLHQQGMAHVPLFFLFALLLWLTMKVYEGGNWRHFAALGLTAGLITVIRPVDGLCVFIPVLYVAGKPFLQTKLQFIKDHWVAILLAACCFLAPVIPQLLYWKWLTGYSVYDSYGPHQGFDFMHPAILKGLFGASNGWLFYTPMMVLAIAGLAMFRRMGPFTIAIPLFLALYVWGVYSWYLPNYPNGLGSRPMVDVYAVLALPLAAFIQWVSQRSIAIKLVATFHVIGFVSINIVYACRQSTGAIWSEDSKYGYNFRMLFKSKPDYNDLVLWDTGIPQPDARQLSALLPGSCATLEVIANDPHFLADSTGATVFRMVRGEEYAPVAVTSDLDSPGGVETRWIRCSGRFRTEDPEYDIYQNHLMVLQLRRGDSIIAWHGVRINNKTGLLEQPPTGGEAGLFRFRHGITGKVAYFVPLPEGALPGDMLRLDVWNISRKPIEISALCLEAFK